MENSPIDQSPPGFADPVIIEHKELEKLKDEIDRFKELFRTHAMVGYDASLADKEVAIANKLKELGWANPKELSALLNLAKEAKNISKWCVTWRTSKYIEAQIGNEDIAALNDAINRVELIRGEI